MTMLVFAERPLPEGLEGLAELALDLRWSGSQTTDQLWEMLDHDAWERTKNPYMILQNVPQTRLEHAARDEQLKAILARGLEERRHALEGVGWYGDKHKQSPLNSVAYFSMEFGLSEALPIYSGGLGILAGDHLKTASDLGVPLVGVGLLYQQGYFRQLIDKEGFQLEAMPYNDPTCLPVVPVEDPEGGWLRISVWLPGRTLYLRVWKAQVGKITLILLDSNDPLNSPWDRAITANLYAGNMERRLIQEVVLGYGGWRVLQELGIKINVCHLNEGHAAFVVLARARSFMEKNECSFYEALRATRAGNVFTTHTPVTAGFDRYEPSLIRQYAERLAYAVNVAPDYVMGLARQNPNDQNEYCNMAYLAMRGCAHVNAVSELHGVISRGIFTTLYPGWPLPETPVGYVTNGVHVPTWDNQATHDLWMKAVGDDRWSEKITGTELTKDKVSDLELWDFRSKARKRLIDYVRRRYERQVNQHGASAKVIERAAHVLDPNALTIGFARRFATYKRPTLLLHDQERLARILLSTDRPVQFIIAGKAHPDDQPGKKLVQALSRFADRNDLYDRVVYLSDYDMALAQELVGGVDVWLNNPRRPWEACGTSGMKVLVNGGLNLSELDGWWAEAYEPEVGWALGDGHEHWDDPEWDVEEAKHLYTLLETEVVPAFYNRTEEGLPIEWLAKVRASMNKLTPQFSSARMVREYVDNFYIPAASAFEARAADHGAVAKEMEVWHKSVEDNWKAIRMTNLHVTSDAGGSYFDLHVYLGDLKPEWAQVQLYAEALDGDKPVIVPMEQVAGIAGAINAFVFRAKVSGERPANHYTPRVVPFHPNAFVPIEETHIAWMK